MKILAIETEMPGVSVLSGTGWHPPRTEVRGFLGGSPGWSATILAQAVSVQASSMLPWGPSQWPILATFPCGCRARRRSWQTRLPPDR